MLLLANKKSISDKILKNSRFFYKVYDKKVLLSFLVCVRYRTQSIVAKSK